MKSANLAAAARFAGIAAISVAFFAACNKDMQAPTEVAPRPLFSAAGGVSGAIYTTDKGATIVNGNVQYGFATDVYVSGGPQNTKASGLPDGTYYFQVTDPSGAVLLSTDNAACRQLTVAGGRVSGAAGPACKHANGSLNFANGVTAVQLAPFATTDNSGGVYKAWMIPTANATVSATDPKVLIFDNSSAKTDNFKVNGVTPTGIMPAIELALGPSDGNECRRLCAEGRVGFGDEGNRCRQR